MGGNKQLQSKNGTETDICRKCRRKKTEFVTGLPPAVQCLGHGMDIGKKVKAVYGSYSTAALRHIVLLPQ